MSDYLILDLKQHPKYMLEFQRVLQLIEKSNDALKENYRNLNPHNFERFTTLIKDGKIMAFSALQIDEQKWFPETGRAITRAWKDDSLRVIGKFSDGDESVFRNYNIPDQLEHAKKIGLKTIFISRESKPRAFQNWLDGVNSVNNTNFEILPIQYNVCGNICPVPESCVQWIAIHEIIPGGKEHWIKSMSEFCINST